MRKSLLESFDKIYILDLHGSSKKKEVSPDGSPDNNVFDITQGVSINIFIKTGLKKKSTLGKVYHSEIYGKRDVKYTALSENSINSIKWNQLENKKPYFFFVPKNFNLEAKYNKGFKINDLMEVNVAGIETIRDSITIHFDDKSLKETVHDFLELEENQIAEKYKTQDSRDWKIERAKQDVIQNFNNDKVWQSVSYRPFDLRKTFYSGKQNGFVCNGRYNVMKHLLNENIGLIVKRGWNESKSAPAFISKYISDRRFWSRPGMQGAESIFPLYLYSDNKSDFLSSESRIPNLNPEIVNQISKNIDLVFTNEKEINKNTFSPIDIIDYIYAILHSSKYRKKYDEFLKIDFPRVPYPNDKKTFFQLVKLGEKLRQVHLFESTKLNDYVTSYPKDGDNIITTKIGKKDWELFDEENKLGRIWINNLQYFDNIPLAAWEFYIGGYQPAQKWLKDRKQKVLDFNDILHYQKIIVALLETDSLMNNIDEVKI